MLDTLFLVSIVKSGIHYFKKLRRKNEFPITVADLASIGDAFSLSEFKVGTVVVPIIGDGIYSVSTLQCLFHGFVVTQIRLS